MEDSSVPVPKIKKKRKKRKAIKGKSTSILNMPPSAPTSPSALGFGACSPGCHQRGALGEAAFRAATKIGVVLRLFSSFLT